MPAGRTFGSTAWWPHGSRRNAADVGRFLVDTSGRLSIRADALARPRATYCLTIAHRDERPPQGVNERRERPHVISQFLTLVAQGLNFGLGGRIGNRQSGDLPNRHGTFVITETIPGPTGHPSSLRSNPPELLHLHFSNGPFVEPINDRRAVAHDVAELLRVVVLGVMERTESVA